ncbi:MAG: 3-deoxy-D-manno-octulosonate 8-phosphate phosphatase [Candidatus Cloacimonetes bacterium HGW-Cloacimonetes-1]|jgi:3-deoxy-D-manno-octulosonate 8-phosphate phosphatase (KDO 8-P phosphatase)|nr:MAG: 3-deoxy-D-manno-octulosonate 8-phosphate phosphatase [Candidatus Cloacimonetes bacterium HGW-Cloacimonetes-1]
MNYDLSTFSRPIKKPVIWKDIRMMIFDCDGVLTDGKIIYSGEMLESKNFDAHDGMGFFLLNRAGLIPAVITGRSSKALSRRCEDLKIPHVLQGIKRKLDITEELLSKLGLNFSQVIYMGDDWNDIPVMQLAALSCCPADAMPEIRNITDYIATRNGGQGAARECIDYVLKNIGIYEKTVLQYLQDIT